MNEIKKGFNYFPTKIKRGFNYFPTFKIFKWISPMLDGRLSWCKCTSHETGKGKLIQDITHMENEWDKESFNYFPTKIKRGFNYFPTFKIFKWISPMFDGRLSWCKCTSHETGKGKLIQDITHMENEWDKERF